MQCSSTRFTNPPANRSEQPQPIHTRHNHRTPISTQKHIRLQGSATWTTWFKIQSCEKVSSVRLPRRMLASNAQDIYHPSQFPYNKGTCHIPHIVHNFSNKKRRTTIRPHDITPEPRFPQKINKQQSQDSATRATRFKIPRIKVGRVRMTTINAHDINHPSQFPCNESK
jgi:hypothetical protein